MKGIWMILGGVLAILIFGSVGVILAQTPELNQTGCSHIVEIHNFPNEEYLMNVSLYPGDEYRVQIC